MHCQLGQVERAVERSGGVGEEVSEYEAGSEFHCVNNKKYSEAWWITSKR